MQKFVAVSLSTAVVALAGARVAKWSAREQRPADSAEEPFAPSPEAAPIVSLGYREACADVMWIRLLGYFGSRQATADGLGHLVDAIVAFDPKFRRVYEYGARAITMADTGVDNAAYLHAIAILERGTKEFPDDYRIPELAGQIYTQDLKTDDPAQRRDWDEKGTLLIESAIRKPGAPAAEATWAAKMRSKLGQKQRAITELREMILITSDVDARKRMLERLAELTGESSDDIASETYEETHKFVSAWHRDRPTLPPSMYILIGARTPAGFDMTDLATGGRDLVTASAADDPSNP